MEGRWAKWIPKKQEGDSNQRQQNKCKSSERRAGRDDTGLDPPSKRENIKERKETFPVLIRDIICFSCNWVHKRAAWLRGKGGVGRSEHQGRRAQFYTALGFISSSIYTWDLSLSPAFHKLSWLVCPESNKSDTARHASWRFRAALLARIAVTL